MPKYKVETDRGAFVVELDRAPTSPEELQAAVATQLEGMAPAPAERPATAPPAAQGGMFSDAMGMLRQAAGAVDPMGEMVTSRMAGETPRLEGAAAAARFAAVPGATNPLTMGAAAAGGELMAQGFEQEMGAREGFDPTSAAVAGAIPPVMAGATKGAQWGAKKLPGAAATLHQMAKQSLDKLSTIFGPTQSSDELYAVVNQFDPRIPLPNLRGTAKTLLSKEGVAASGLKLPGVAGVGGELAERSATKVTSVDTGLLSARGRPISRKVIENPEGGLSFQDVRVNLRRIGDKIRETREVGGEEHGAWKALFKALMDDMDAAAASGKESLPAVRALKQANAAARREFVSEEIADIFTKGGLSARPDIGPDAFAVNFGRIANDLRKGKHAADIKAVLSTTEYDDLLKIVSDLSKATPNLPPPRGQFAGSAVRIGQIAGGGAMGYLAGPALGLPPDQATMLGVAAGSVGVNVLTRLMMNDSGRRLLTHFLSQSGGVVTQKMLSVLGLAAAQLPEVRGTVGDGTVRLGDLGRQQFMGR